MVKASVLGGGIKPLRMLVLASKPWGMAPSQRFRFEQWAPRLKREHGFELRFKPFESAELSQLLYRQGHAARKAALLLSDAARRWSVIDLAEKSDIVLIHREAALIGPPLIERAIARTGTPIIFDFDDAIWRSDRRRSRLFECIRGYDKFGECCRLARAVTAGSPYLAEKASAFNESVMVMPTSIETDEYVVMPQPPDDEFVVSWTGSLSTLKHFELAREPLENLAKRIPLAIKVICNRPPERPINGARNIFVEWSARNEAAEVADCHVGIMPLPDDDFTRGKCGLKALQFMASGRPVIVSPVGVNRSIVEDGVSGYFASTDSQWVERLEHLARKPETRASMGRAARERAKRDYSAEHVANMFADVVRSVLKR